VEASKLSKKNMEGGEEDLQSPLQRSFSSPGGQEEPLERTGN